jgi:hypothetical protein
MNTDPRYGITYTLSRHTVKVSEWIWTNLSDFRTWTCLQITSLPPAFFAFLTNS